MFVIYLPALFLKYLCVGAQECVDLIEDMLEEIYGGSVYDEIQDIIGGIYHMTSLKAGWTCTVWLGIGVSYAQLVCIISDV